MESEETRDTGHTQPEEARSVLEQQQEEQNLRRLQLMMNMVMSVIAQDTTLTYEAASEMIADSRRAALAMFPDKELAYELIYQPTTAAAHARPLPPAVDLKPRLAPLLLLHARQPQRNGAPEQPSPHLHRQVPVVVRVPDPDVARGSSPRLHPPSAPREWSEMFPQAS